MNAVTEAPLPAITRGTVLLCVAIVSVLALAPAAVGTEDADHEPSAPSATSSTPRPAVPGYDHSLASDVDDRLAEIPPLDQHDELRDSLVRDYGISASEARERLQWQVATQDFPVSLSALLGQDFGGTWIDQHDGGRIKIGVTSRVHHDTLRAFLDTRGAGSYTDVVDVEYSDDDLHGMVSRLSLSLSGVNASADLVVSVGIDHRANRVVVDVPPQEARTEAQQDFVEAVRQHAIVELREEAGPPANRRSCSGNSCNPPLRAGVKIRLPFVRECTSGFTARSRTDGLPYLFTAGHCLRNHHTVTWETWTPGPQVWREIGRRHNHQYANNQGDFGIIRVNNGAYWDPRPWLLLYSGPDSNRNTRYVVRRTDFSRNGMRICYSGAFSGSRCGEVDKIGDTLTSENGVTTVGLARFHGAGCGQPGDSGGPTFSFGTAYGLVVGGKNIPLLGCRLLYQGINGAAATMNVWVNTGE